MLSPVAINSPADEIAGFIDDGVGVNGEVYYRTMTKADYQTFLKTGKIPATCETFISPTKTFSQNYNGVTLKFNVKPGTTNALSQVGVRDMSRLASKNYGNLPFVQKGWNISSAYFKTESLNGVQQMNIGLGKGQALDIFNSNIQFYQVVK